jgi:FixJ family two-component response regulator
MSRLDESSPAIVAVIEDDEASRSALGRLLWAGGYEPVLFDSAETFMASLRDRAWLCLIVDVHLPGMSGLDLQGQLIGEGAHVPVVITTGDRADAVRERAQHAGCAAFLWKPVKPDTLFATLTAIRLSAH